MNFQQTKLTKTEWEGCEIPVCDEEKQILNLIRTGYKNVNYKYNNNLSLITFIKIQNTPEIENYLYIKYFKPLIEKIFQNTNASILQIFTPFFEKTKLKIKPLIKIHKIKIDNFDNTIRNTKQHDTQYNNLYEFNLLKICKEVINALNKNDNI